MKVRAKFPENKFGYYGGLRRYDNNEFTLSNPEHFSEKWMVKIGNTRGRPPKQEAKQDEGAQ